MSTTGDVETLNSLWRLIMQQSRASASEHTSKGDSLYAACEIFVLMDFLHVWTALNKMENNSSVKRPELSMRQSLSQYVHQQCQCHAMSINTLHNFYPGHIFNHSAWWIMSGSKCIWNLCQNKWFFGGLWVCLFFFDNTTSKCLLSPWGKMR